MNVILVAAGHNLRKILNWLRDLFVRFTQKRLIYILKDWFVAISSTGCRLVKLA